MLDVAFAKAFQAECASLPLTPHEALLLLDALDVDLAAPVATLVQALPPDVAPVEVPALHAAAFAAVLSGFARGGPGGRWAFVRHPNALSISEEAAGRGIARIRALVEGAWLGKARATILSFCDGKSRLGRPSLWASGNVKALFVTALGFPDKTFLALSGKEVLELGRGKLWDHFRVGPSLLQARFAVYQHTLRLLEQWWEQGHRPGDDLKDASLYAAGLLGPLVWPPLAAPSRLAAGELAAAAPAAVELPRLLQPMAPPALKRTKRSKKAKAGVISALAALAATPLPSSPKRWGQVQPGERQAPSAEAELAVEVAPLEALLVAWVPLNRAYGWGVPLDVLTSLGGRVGGAVGSLLFPQHTRDLDGGALDPVKGCFWVAFAAEPVPGQHPFHRFEPFAKHGIVHRVAGPEGGASEPRFAVLVPAMCLRRAADVLLLTAPHGGSLSAADVRVGMALRVVDVEALRRACERFEWWDRPPPEALEDMAGQRCEVVSISELHSVHRVGVRIEATGAFDGLPLEALFREAGPAPRQRTKPRSAPSDTSRRARGLAADVPALPGASLAWPERADAPVPSISVSVSAAAPQRRGSGSSSGPEAAPPAAAAARPAAGGEKPKSAPKGPRIKVRERRPASQYQGPTSADVVQEFYLRALDRPAHTATWDPVFSVRPPQSDTAETPPADSAFRELPHYAVGQAVKVVPALRPEHAVEVYFPLSSERPPTVTPLAAPLLAPQTAPHSPPVPPKPKFAFSQAQFDMENAIFDIGVRASAERLHEGLAPKKAGKRPSSAAPELPTNTGKMAVVDVQFDAVNAIFDIEPPVEAAPKAPPKQAKKTPGNLGGEDEASDGEGDDEDKDGNGDGATLPLAVDPWDDGSAFLISGANYNVANIKLAFARRVQIERERDVEKKKDPDETPGKE